MISQTDIEDYHATLETIRWIVHGIIPEGMTIAGGKPKIGKSWLFLQMALNVVGGQQVLGRYSSTKSEVLYLALEDNRARLQDRVRKLCGGTPPPPGLRFITATDSFPRLDNGGLDQLRQHVKRHPETRFIVIDTLQKIKPFAKGKGNAYEQDVAACSALHKFALEHRLAIVLVHHLRRGGLRMSSMSCPAVSGCPALRIPTSSFE